MRYSTLFPKTLRQAPKDASTPSHRLLYQGGFIRESTAGRYYFLPLGMRVRNKLITIIREEMNKAGAQEMITPILHPLELWKETNRTESTGFELTTVKDRRDAEFALGGTAEEMFTDLVRHNKLSYRELPFNLYQFSPKFRDEMRARGGLLRVREFVMKDAYSFDLDENEFKKEYQKMRNTYKKIFDRLGLKTTVVESDNGYIGGEYCHEFVVDCEAGESKYLMSEDGKYAAHEDVAQFQRDDINSREEMKPYEIIEQPKWVQTMEDNVKHYKLPKSRFLKNVVYKTSDGRIIIGVIRGDLDVNPIKLGHVVNSAGALEPATDEDLASIGTKHGYVHSWGHEGITYIGDISLTTVRNFIGGQKEDATDSYNVNYGRDFECEQLADIAIARDGHMTEDGSQKLTEHKGIEVGNIFQLGYHYSKLMNATYIDQAGKEQFYYMGCYGIGIGRTLATIVEKYHDDHGIVWPLCVCPFQVHMVVLGQRDETRLKAAKLHDELLSNDIDVLYDDRDEVTAGVKFADADLVGIPYRLLISDRSLETNSVEIKSRSSQEKGELIPLKESIKHLQTIFAK